MDIVGQCRLEGLVWKVEKLEGLWEMTRKNPRLFEKYVDLNLLLEEIKSLNERILDVCTR